jgi:hypothetical protein
MLEGELLWLISLPIPIIIVIRPLGALGGPHRAIAVGDLTRDNSRSEVTLAGVVGDLDGAGESDKRQELLARV